MTTRSTTKRRGLSLKLVCAAVVLAVGIACGIQAQAADIAAHQGNTGPFETPQEVTQSCLMCHSKVADEILKSTHWLWMADKTFESAEEIERGKANILNNFCIAIDSNWPRCTSCHIGYGWKDSTFDFSKKENIDCMVCHDQTGTYKKFPTGAGYPVSEPTPFSGKEFLPPDYANIAQHVGATSRQTCGACHFYGGGGDGVKHGDMDSSLKNPSRELDVHMGGMDFQCTECHQSEEHHVTGSLYASAKIGKEGDNRFTCESCHDDLKHNSFIEKHLDSVACETCHIPRISRELPTKVWWDWSTAGTDGEEAADEFGKPTWAKKKGTFKWNKNFVPEYTWSNGRQELSTKDQPLDMEGDIALLNRQLGSIDDPESKIMPFKVMRGKQPYDTERNVLIVPKLFGKDGFWKTWDWEQSANLGMEAAGIEYSGKMGWIETAMYWPIHHQIAPKEDALGCMDCHGKSGRMDWKGLGYDGDPKKSGGRKLDK